MMYGQSFLVHVDCKAVRILARCQAECGQKGYGMSENITSGIGAENMLTLACAAVSQASCVQYRRFVPLDLRVTQTHVMHDQYPERKERLFCSV